MGDIEKSGCVQQLDAPRVQTEWSTSAVSDALRKVPS